MAGRQVARRFGHDLELNLNFTYEPYLTPICQATQQSAMTTALQLTRFPKKISF